MEFAGAYVLCTGKQELYRKFLPRLNSVCMSQTRRRVWEPFGREFTSSAEAPARGCRLTDAADPLRGPAGFAAGAPPAGRRFRQNGRTMSARPFLCLHKRERSICRHPAVRPSASRRAAGPWPGSRRPRRRRRRPPGPGRWAGTCCSAWGWSAPA